MLYSCFCENEYFTNHSFLLLIAEEFLAIVTFLFLDNHKHQTFIMPTLPPNDPNHNHNINAAKEVPHDGRRRQPRNGEIMDVFGDMHDSPAVVVMFLIGLAGWLLRERCTC
jgi:hypothetical protein